MLSSSVSTRYVPAGKAEVMPLSRKDLLNFTDRSVVRFDIIMHSQIMLRATDACAELLRPANQSGASSRNEAIVRSLV